METVSDIAAAPTPLEQQRVELRAFSEEVMAAIKQLPMPKTWLEGERAMRCIGASDRILVQLHTEPKQPKPVETPIDTRTPRELVEQYPFSPEVSAFLKRKYQAMEDAQPETPEETPFVYRFDDDGVDDAASSMPGDSDIGPVFDALMDDLEALTDAIATGKEIPAPSRSYPPAKTAPFSNADDGSYAMAKMSYDNLRMFHDLKTAGASP